jgi:hypothetical protein
VEWALDNCYMLARRELKRLGQQMVSPTAPRPDPLTIERWEHVKRICEQAGLEPHGVLRRTFPTEITDGSGAAPPVGEIERLIAQMRSDAEKHRADAQLIRAKNLWATRSSAACEVMLAQVHDYWADQLAALAGRGRRDE